MLPNLSPFIRNRVHHHNLNRQHYKRGVEKYAVLQSGGKYEERGVSLQHCSFPSCSNIPSATAGKKISDQKDTLEGGGRGEHRESF